LNEKKITVVEIYTDGACRGNPGPGGWGVVMQYQGQTKELFGGEVATTNNRMELMAAIMALENLKCSCKVDLNIDSQYVLKVLPSGFLIGKSAIGGLQQKNPLRMKTYGAGWIRL